MEQTLGKNNRPTRSGRPKGSGRKGGERGILGQLVRTQRHKLGLGLNDLARACDCSVQFISNIEHGRAPLPWDKAEALARALELRLEEVHAANLAIRSDFQALVGSPDGSTHEAASALAVAAKFPELGEFLRKYPRSSPKLQKAALEAAMKILRSN